MYGRSSWARHYRRQLSNAQFLQVCLTALLSTVPGKRSLRSKSELSIPGKHPPQAEKEVIENILWSFSPPGPQAAQGLAPLWCSLLQLPETALPWESPGQSCAERKQKGTMRPWTMLKVCTGCPGRRQRQWVQRPPGSVLWPSALSEDLGREAQNGGADGHPETLEEGMAVRCFLWSQELSLAQWPEAEV